LKPKQKLLQALAVADATMKRMRDPPKKLRLEKAVVPVKMMTASKSEMKSP